MQAMIFEGPHSLRLADVPEPIPSAGEVKLRILLAGVCSTDIHILHGRFPVRPPRILGHELAGVVEAVGTGVSKEWIGKICGVRPAWFCGVCPACLQGHPELCLNFKCLGNTHDGGFAEKTIVRVDQLVPSPDLSPLALVWLEPLACVIHALDLCQPIDTKSVLVIGAGIFGKLVVQVLHSTSAARIAAVDPNFEKIDQARALGAHEGWIVPRKGKTIQIDDAIHDWSQGGPRIVIDTTGLPGAIKHAIHWAGPAGQVLLFGVSDPTARMMIQPETIFSKELSIQAVVGMTPDSFQSALALLKSRLVDPSIQAKTYTSLDQLPEKLKNPNPNRDGKVFIQPRDSNG
jgi:threonine dehydrogenase-like Zn-dependent dehydrogenase